MTTGVDAKATGASSGSHTKVEKHRRVGKEKIGTVSMYHHMHS